MGHLFSNKIYFDIRNNKEITDKLINEILSGDTDRIQVHCYQFNITSSGWKKLNEVFKKNPQIKLRLFSGLELDLKFLNYLPDLQSLALEVNKIKNEQEISTLHKLKELVFYVNSHDDFKFFNSLDLPIELLYLGTDQNKNGKIDISSILKFSNLKFLKIEKYNKNLEKIIPEFTKLEELSLRSVSGLKNIDFIAKHKSLLKLQIASCGIDEYGPLSEMKKLKALSLWKPAKLQTLDIISQMTGLQYLFLQTVNNPSTFPDIENLKKLRRVVLYAMKSIRNFQTLENTKNLKEFSFYEIQNQQIEDFIPILKNRYIERIDLWSLKSGYRKKLEDLMNEYGRKREYINFLSDSDFVYE